MPFKSKAQQRYLMSKASPLSAAQKSEWSDATDYKAIPERKKPLAPRMKYATK